MSNDCNCNIRVVVGDNNPIGVNMSESYNYNSLTNKPSINGVVLQGNKTTSDLNINLTDKLDKVTTTSDNDRVYIITGEGEQSTLITDRKSGGDRKTEDVIVKRTYKGNIWLPAISDINNDHYAVPKDYVDTALSSKQDILTAGNGITIIDNVISSQSNDNWELINTATFTETATNHIKFTKDSNNNDFSLKKYRLVFNLVGSETISNGRISYSDIDDSSRYAATNLYFGLSYGGALPTAIVETVYQFPGQGTILLNTCNTRCNLISMANGRWNTSTNDYNKTAPFTLINIFWGTENTGTIQLWGVK